MAWLSAAVAWLSAHRPRCSGAHLSGSPRGTFVISWVLACSLVFHYGISHATYKPRENRWAAQIQETLLIGIPVWLKDGKGVPFFSIYTTSGDAPRGAVLLLHDSGLHPDWQGVISPLRRELPEHNWATLSLQMPLLPTGAPLTAFGPVIDESLPRIRAGIEFLHAKGIRTIVIIGHGLGGAMGAAFLAANTRSGIAGFVGIALDAPTIDSTINTLDPRLFTPNTLARLKLPVLDIYGGSDRKSVTESAPLRVAAARKAHNTQWAQVRLPDADHFLQGQDKLLTKTVLRWLDKISSAR